MQVKSSPYLKRLTPEQVVAICTRYAAGEVSPALAREFGVTAKTITDTLRRRGLPVRPRGYNRLLVRSPFTDLGDGSANIYLGHDRVCRVDRGDAEWLDQWKLSAFKPTKGQERTYARRQTRAGSVFMHRLILGLQPGDALQADHINHDGLDNRRVNLRAVTQAENKRHVHPARLGVYRDPAKTLHPWRARVAYKGARQYLGYFATIAEAAAVVAAWRAQHM